MDLPPAVRQMRHDLEGWAAHISQFKIERKAAEAALVSMTQNVATRLDAYKRKVDIPEEIFRQMRTCQTAANEFLRQFWSAIYPPAGETLGGPTTVAQRTTKATRMAGYLIKTPEKVAAIIRAAEMAGVDRGRVQTVGKSVFSFSSVVVDDYNGFSGHAADIGCSEQSTRILGNEKSRARAWHAWCPPAVMM